MPKLFLFAIGGTGSRVVKALTMLLAAGVDASNTDVIVPIIIDPDSANGDLTRTVEIVKTYKEIREKSASDKSAFFKTKISSLDELGEGGFVSDNFTFDIEGVKEHLFKDFIGYSELDRSNRAFTSLLFSKNNLNADMDVGFKGNPNIGSVVLNKFKDSAFFKKFASNFEQNDRVFIISSIFGGTGAAGFPLILKNIRDAAHPLPHHNFLRSARIGAVSILPYFGVDKNDKTSIDSNTFISKTKAALSYYARNVSGNNSINALYYIGDIVTNDQKGADGAGQQRNKAHFIELAAALSVIDFTGLTDADLNVVNGAATNPKFFEFGLQKETASVSFADLAKETHDIVAKPLTRFALYQSFLENHYTEFSEAKGEAWASNGNNKLTKDALGVRYRNSLSAFNQHFREWLQEMSHSNVSFNPIDFTKSGKDIFNLVNGTPEKKGFLTNIFKGAGLGNYRNVLSELEPQFDHLTSSQKFMALFSQATGKIVDEKINV